MSSLRLIAAIAVLACLVALLAVPAFAGTGKTPVCHINGDGSMQTIEIADPALPAHVAHGDYPGPCLDQYGNAL